ncbi:MAG: hypothetical protein A2063_10435 [Gallionellales bacterium GWA2_60_142]|nr:MAG: hypothetical protein A2063_10435 [Gallionellales bacterium GWA2_60_142]
MLKLHTLRMRLGMIVKKVSKQPFIWRPSSLLPDAWNYPFLQPFSIIRLDMENAHLRNFSIPTI